jgi:hypothetical protein
VEESRTSGEVEGMAADQALPEGEAMKELVIEGYVLVLAGLS